MKKISARIIAALVAVITLLVCFAVNSSASDGWIYADKLPEGVTDENYIIEYRNRYTTVSATLPGDGWVNKGLNKVVYENDGEPYESDFSSPVSPTRELVGYYYFHYCSASTGVRVNYALTDTYHHYDAISPGNFYECYSVQDDDDPAYTAYQLKYYDGNYVYCASGVTCDGQWGSHGNRSNLWYKKYIYQNKTEVKYYNFEKKSDWVSVPDSAATDYTVRYKVRHNHVYGAWTVTKKATFTADGSRYRICKTCSLKETKPIYKVSGTKLSATSYVYNGKVKKPAVTVRNSKGTNIYPELYSVSYSSGRKNIGTYKVKVTLKGANYTGTKNLSFKIVPAKVTSLKAAAKKDSVKLTWAKVTGTVKYKVYSYNTSTKKLTHLATTSNNYWTNTSLSSKNTYSYVVKAYKRVDGGDYYSSSSAVVKAQPYGAPAKVTGLTCSSKGETTLTLKWNKAAGNSVKYYVYSYNASTKKYSKIATTSSTQYKVTGLKASKTYKYYVRAYCPKGDGYLGAKSDILSVKTKEKMTSPAVKSFNASTEKKFNNVLLTWKADSTVKGFVVYKSSTNKSGSFKKIATLAASASSYRDTNVTAGLTYYYKVRTYKMNGDETVYGKYTVTMKVDTYGGWREKLGIADYSYKFENSFEGFGYSYSYRIPISSFQIVFGKTALARQMWEEYGDGWGGNCHGMCATSALLNHRKSGVTISMFNSSVSKVSQLGVNDKGSLGLSVREFIEAMQISQMSSQIYRNRNWNDPDALLKEACLIPYTAKPIIIGVSNDIMGISHALLGLRAVKVSDTQINVELYDSNYPGKIRNLILTVNSEGKVLRWSYEIDSNHVIKSTGVTSEIEYLTYDDYSVMWTKRGTFTQSILNNNTLMVNSESFSIYDSEDNLIATVTNGVAESAEDDIVVVDPQKVLGTDDSAPMLVYLPTDETYTVKNNDESVEVFEATMVNIDRSAEVSTESDTVTFTVSDSEEINEVSLESNAKEKFTVILDSSDSVDEEKIEVIGEGEGETVVVSVSDGETTFENCENAEVNK